MLKLEYGIGDNPVSMNSFPVTERFNLWNDVYDACCPIISRVQKSYDISRTAQNFELDERVLEQVLWAARFLGQKFSVQISPETLKDNYMLGSHFVDESFMSNIQGTLISSLVQRYKGSSTNERKLLECYSFVPIWQQPSNLTTDDRPDGNGIFSSKSLPFLGGAVCMDAPFGICLVSRKKNVPIAFFSFIAAGEGTFTLLQMQGANSHKTNVTPEAQKPLEKKPLRDLARFHFPEVLLDTAGAYAQCSGFQNIEVIGCTNNSLLRAGTIKGEVAMRYYEETPRNQGYEMNTEGNWVKRIKKST